MLYPSYHELDTRNNLEQVMMTVTELKLYAGILYLALTGILLMLFHK